MVTVLKSKRYQPIHLWSLWRPHTLWVSVCRAFLVSDLRNIPLWSLRHDNRESSKVRAAPVSPVDHLEDRLSEGVGGGGRERERAIFIARKWERERFRSDERNVGEWSAERKQVFQQYICHLLVMDQNVFVCILWKFAHNKLTHLRIRLSLNVIIKTIMTTVLTPTHGRKTVMITWSCLSLPVGYISS